MEHAAPLTLGVLDLVPAFDGTDDAGALAQAVRLARAAEASGYRRYWAAEHHDMPGLACPAPEILLAHIGARTNAIRLGTGALLLPHYKPLKVAETFHMLAVLYPNRIDLGLGRAPGGNAHVSMALSGNFLERVRQLPDTLRELTELFAGTYAYEGQPVRARPTPPAPPELWMLGTNAKSAAYAAELGLGYAFGQFMSDTPGDEAIRAYREAFKPSPFLREPKAIAAVGVVCAPTDEEARELASRTPGFMNEGAEGREADERKRIVGSPKTVRSRLAELQSLYGADEWLIVTMIPDYELRIRSYELLAGAAP
ncbi:MsnO8 family LLM class oxidoreductase [Paenibacillus sp.]|uniref:MsnO8 family LLM class oxidoreductase n=1 Tax=Paenibacillus sp. TaxID=58172 RepID=UPI002D60A9A6|nr:MsnO8 family LLM class oxidoreductase [Paenibacillus sp.]HZG85432.1 MsnO8 family LLM class oxidoreductase [Paenibacillus sp.]